MSDGHGHGPPSVKAETVKIIVWTLAFVCAVTVVADLFYEIGTFLAPILPSDFPLPLKWAIDELLGDDPFLWYAACVALDTDAGKLFWNPENVNPNLIYQFLKHGLPNTTTNCFKQFMEWADTGKCALRGVEISSQMAAQMGLAAKGWPVQATSPTANSPGSSVRPSTSATTPPH